MKSYKLFYMSYRCLSCFICHDNVYVSLYVMNSYMLFYVLYMLFYMASSRICCLYVMKSYILFYMSWTRICFICHEVIQGKECYIVQLHQFLTKTINDYCNNIAIKLIYLTSDNTLKNNPTRSNIKLSYSCSYKKWNIGNY